MFTPSTPLAMYAAHWLHAVRPHVAAETWRNYEWALRMYVVPVLGDHSLGTLTRVHVRAFADGMRRAGTLQPSSLKLVLTILRALVSAAIEDELRVDNPARRPTRAIRLPTTASRPALLGREARAVLTCAQTLVPQLFPLFLFMARTGSRIGETLGLSWAYVDLETRCAYLMEQPWPRGRVTRLKNGRGHFVDLSAQLTLALRTLQRNHGSSLWVFAGPTGYPWHRSTVHRAFARIRVAAGVDARVVPHSFRHGFASVLLRRGEPLAYVQRALDHGDPKLTATLYGSHLPNRRLSAVDGLDDC